MPPTIRTFGINPCIGERGLPIIRNGSIWKALDYKTGALLDLPFDVNPNFFVGFGNTFVYLNGTNSRIYDYEGNDTAPMPAPFPFGWGNILSVWLDANRLKLTTQHYDAPDYNQSFACWSSAGTLLETINYHNAMPANLGGPGFGFPNPNGGELQDGWRNQDGALYGYPPTLATPLHAEELAPHHDGVFCRLTNGNLILIPWPQPQPYDPAPAIIGDYEIIATPAAPWRLYGCDVDGAVVRCADGILRNISPLKTVIEGSALALSSSFVGAGFALCYSHLW